MGGGCCADSRINFGEVWSGYFPTKVSKFKTRKTRLKT